MSAFRMQWLTALALGAGVACGGGGSGPNTESLVATWIASPAHSSTMVEFVDKSNPSVKLDIVGTKSATVTLALKQDKTFQLRMVIPNEAVRIEDGTWKLEESDTLTLTYSPTDNMQFAVSLSGSTLTLSGADAPFDLDDDGVEESTKLTVKMVRR